MNPNPHQRCFSTPTPSNETPPPPTVAKRHLLSSPRQFVLHSCPPPPLRKAGGGGGGSQVRASPAACAQVRCPSGMYPSLDCPARAHPRFEGEALLPSGSLLRPADLRRNPVVHRLGTRCAPGMLQDREPSPAAAGGWCARACTRTVGCGTIFLDALTGHCLLMQFGLPSHTRCILILPAL